MSQPESRDAIHILALESTCDETAAAVVNGQLQILSSVVASQNEFHAAFQGVVPEIAARAHVEAILPVIDQALRQSGVELADLSAIAVATKPGLAGSLLIGLMAAKALCVALDKSLIEVNHIHAHLYACGLERAGSIFPCVGLVVSGGHTSLYRCESPRSFKLLGATIDDAAGEAFDKVAAMMGLPFPGGPALAKLADEGDSRRYPFPRSLPDDHGPLSFSFSGLKTAVRYALAAEGRSDLAPPMRLKPGLPPPPQPESKTLSRETLANIAASFQGAVIDVLAERSKKALAQTGHKRICVGGGVALNRSLREQLPMRLGHDCEVIFAPAAYCTDNAAMGAIAVEAYLAGEFASLEVDCQPGLLRTTKK